LFLIVSSIDSIQLNANREAMPTANAIKALRPRENSMQRLFFVRGSTMQQKNEIQFSVVFFG
jgi:hypothetical protein